MKKFASKSGFTLVELIVVIAILGILAAVAVPTYSGYIAKAKEASDMVQLDAIKTAVDFKYIEKTYASDATTGTAPAYIEVTEGTVSDSVKCGADSNNTSVINISAYYTGTGENGAIDFQSDNNKAVFDGGKWTLSKTGG